MPIQLQLRSGVFLANCELDAPNGAGLVAVVDSGSNRTYVSKRACERASLRLKGRRDDVLCVHGKKHRGASVRYYRGTVKLGTKLGSGTVYEIDVRPLVGGIRVDVILGRDVLRHFKATPNWRDGAGLLEE